MLRGRWLAGILVVCAGASLAQVAQSPQKLPVVKSGDMPFYPPLLRIAQVEGEVDLRVTTDGSSVVSVTSEYGNLLLAKAAQDNVKTWKFEQHDPTVFSTVFSYHLVKEFLTYSCDPDVPDNGTVVLKLPAGVDITSHLRIPDCHDPNEGLDLSEPLRVFLTACEVDGSSVPCDKLTIRLQSGNLTVTPTRFKESEKKQGFVVPAEFRSLKAFGVSVETGHGSLLFGDQNIAFLKGDWRVGIDHAPFKESTPVYGAAATLPCVGFIHFEWGEPEVVTWAPCK
jgi:hypothetical protein